MANEVSWNDHHECKFYDSMDLWWNQERVIFNHVSTFNNDRDLQRESMEQVEMDITLKQNLTQLHHNLSKNVNKNFMTKNPTMLPRWWKITLSW